MGGIIIESNNCFEWIIISKEPILGQDSFIALAILGVMSLKVNLSNASLLRELNNASMIFELIFHKTLVP